jgi:hypothetical protein
MDKPETDPEIFISDLRLHEYGIGEDGRQKKELAPLSRKLKNSIELLSTGLYEKDIHFILELIQNAEDNSYMRRRNGAYSGVSTGVAVRTPAPGIRDPAP